MTRLLIFIALIHSSALAYASNAEFLHCYEFGCKKTQAISFSVEQWEELEAIFSKPALSPWIEKQQIRQAIARMEDFAGQLTGTHLDQARNYNGVEVPNQQDCIDESFNTTQYLNALQQRNFLHWHRVEKKQRRISWIFTHWTAVIRDLTNDTLYAVDSWYRNNGEPPYLQKLSDWRHRASFSEQLNP